jgi:hypothetical protein
VLRFVLWRLLGLLATLIALTLIAWFLRGGPGTVLRGKEPSDVPRAVLPGLVERIERGSRELGPWASSSGLARVTLALGLALGLTGAVAIARLGARCRRRYVRLRVEPYRTDRGSAEEVVGMIEALHKRVLRRWWRRSSLWKRCQREPAAPDPNAAARDGRDRREHRSARQDSAAASVWQAA